MTSIISKNDVERVITSAEQVYKECFNLLLEFKTKNGDVSNTIEFFQPRLAECLYDLMVFYQKLKAEERQLISEKNTYPIINFRTLMAGNNLHAKIVKETIEIGKSLGDAFAWLFYEENRLELIKHFEHPSTGLYVGGIGGKGELEFIKNNQNLDGLFVIYHGITSILRIGDFSLYAMGQGIVGVGELKTEPTEQGIEVNAYISSKIDICDSGKSKDSRNMSISKLTKMPKEFPKLRHQLAVQDQLLFHQDTSEKIVQTAKYDYQLIEQLNSENTITLNENKSLMLIWFSCVEKNLFQILASSESDTTLPDNLEWATRELIVPESLNNRFIIGKINTEGSYLRIPPFWWNIDNKICEKIYFKQIQILTVFNPAHLIQHMENNGFYIVDAEDKREIILSKMVDSHKIEFHNFELLFDLVAYSLMKPQYMIESVDNFIAKVESENYSSTTKIEMIIQQSIFPSSTEH